MTRALPILATLNLGLVLALSPLPGQSLQAAAASGQEQAAAGRLPNTFDNPPAAPRPQAAAQAPVTSTQPPVTVTEAEVADPERVAASEAMLRTTIAAMQAGLPNYDDMSPDLAGKVREQTAAITPLIKSFGTLQSLAHVGVENGADLFLVGFENQITQWIIAMNDEGKIVALLFRPATPPAA